MIRRLRDASWFTTRVRRLTVASTLIVAASGAYATISNVPTLSMFGEFREIALIAVEGDSLPALEAKHSIYKEFLNEAKNQRYPNRQTTQLYERQLKEIQRKIMRLENLRSQYKRR